MVLLSLIKTPPDVKTLFAIQLINFCMLFTVYTNISEVCYVDNQCIICGLKYPINRGLQGGGGGGKTVHFLKHAQFSQNKV